MLPLDLRPIEQDYRNLLLPVGAALFTCLSKYYISVYDYRFGLRRAQIMLLQLEMEHLGKNLIEIARKCQENTISSRVYHYQNRKLETKLKLFCVIFISQNFGSMAKMT